MSLLHRTLWKDIWRCLVKSKGRFFSIMILLAIGSFALVGLKVASPDMGLTAQHYFNAHHLADVQVMSTMGLDKTDCSLLRKIHGVERSECGYLTDVTLGTSNKAIRLFSNSSKISTYEVVSGRLPRSNASSEIALSNQ
ncbi:MAG: ABC transporter permease, partial [Alloscardovia omnicolens]|nr:ABC transporter permease [Alloscardovia omnicolens]